ncbi:MAG: DUF1772 domain-containing protein [Verrucomicrobiales bacterium]|nr:DUF1772 domain-containing protein [Verrucomicrobiota bacterium JB025]
MSLNIIFVTVLALSSAMLSGLLFVFSNFAMKAFGRIPSGSGISAMQSINACIVNPGFFVIFAGTALGSMGTLIMAIRNWQHPSSIWITTGSATLLIGLYLVTAAINVPLNHWLDTVNPAAPDAATAWNEYVTKWQPWNHLRTIASLVAAICFATGALHLVAR